MTGPRLALSRCRPVRDEAFRRGWAAAHPWCCCCGVPARCAAWPGVATHHLVKPGRSDEPCNLMVLCDNCHRLAHGARIRQRDGALLPMLTLGIQFELKRVRDPDAWNPERLEELWGRYLPDLEALPAVFQEEYAAWRPCDRNPVSLERTCHADA